MHSKLKIAIQSSLMCRHCFVQELLSHFILNVSEGNQRTWHKPQEGKLTRPALFSSSLTCQQLGIQFSPTPLLLHLSALTAAQEPRSWRNERERERQRKIGRKEGERERRRRRKRLNDQITRETNKRKQSSSDGGSVTAIFITLMKEKLVWVEIFSSSFHLTKMRLWYSSKLIAMPSNQ